MLKAIEILKSNQKSPYGCSTSIIYENTNLVNEAIKELEELENRSCESCMFYHQGYLCLENGSGNFCPNKKFCCNKYVSKEKK
jgi:hypothetical protein